MAKLHAIKDAADILVRDAVTKEPVAMIDYANTFEVDLKGDLVFALAKGVKRIGFKKPTEGQLKLGCELVDMRTMAMFLGSKIVESTEEVARKEVHEISGGKILLSKTPVDGTVTVFAQDGDRELFAEQVENAKTKITCSGSTITFDQSQEGRKVIVFYWVSGVKVRKFTVNASQEPRTYLIDAFSTVKRDDGSISMIQMNFFKAMAKSNSKYTFDATKPSKFTFDITLMGDPNGDIFTYKEILDDEEASKSRSADLNVTLKDLEGK